MASGPIPSWQIDGETMEIAADFVLGAPNHSNGDWSHEIKRCLLLGRKVLTNLDSILKSRDITLPTKVCLVMYGCESWTIKKAEHQRIDVEAATPIPWPPDVKNWLIRKDSDAGKNWRQEEKGMTENEMASQTQWTWVWVNSGIWWWTGRPGVL